MPSVRVAVPCQMASLDAVVTRCGCREPWAHVGAACPRPLAVENLGTVAYWHRNPFRVLAWRLRRLFNRKG